MWKASKLLKVFVSCFYIETFSTVPVHERDQYIEQSLHTIIALSDDGPPRPEKCTSYWFLIHYFKSNKYVCIHWFKL